MAEGVGTSVNGFFSFGALARIHLGHQGVPILQPNRTKWCRWHSALRACKPDFYTRRASQGREGVERAVVFLFPSGLWPVFIFGIKVARFSADQNEMAFKIASDSRPSGEGAQFP